MNFLVRLLFITCSVIAVGFALWFSLTLFALLFVVGAGAVGLYALRDFLLAKKILNPTPGVPMQEDTPGTTVIEGQYVRIEETKPTE